MNTDTHNPSDMIIDNVCRCSQREKNVYIQRRNILWAGWIWLKYPGKSRSVTREIVTILSECQCDVMFWRYKIELLNQRTPQAKEQGALIRRSVNRTTKPSCPGLQYSLFISIDIYIQCMQPVISYWCTTAVVSVALLELTMTQLWAVKGKKFYTRVGSTSITTG